MEVSGQLHAPTALPLGEKPLVAIGHEVGWALEPVWALSAREKSFTLAGNQIPAAQPAVRRYTHWAIPAWPGMG
jgi:hypothetical protein